MATTPAIARAAAVKRALNKANAAAIVTTYKDIAAKVVFDGASPEDAKKAGAVLRAAGYRTTPLRSGGFLATKVSAKQPVAA